MKRIFSVIVLLFIFFSLLAPAMAADEKTLTWYHAHFPPVTIPDGPDAGKGFYDQITRFLIEKLPQYEHQLVIANYKRILQEIQGGQNVCCASLYKTAGRDKYTAFSLPVVVVLPNGITIKRADQRKFSPFVTIDRKIRLKEVLQAETLLLGVAMGRKYSGGIDETLSTYGHEKNMVVRSGKDVF